MFEFIHIALSFVVLSLVGMQLISKKSFALLILALSTVGLASGFMVHHAHVHSIVDPCWAYFASSAYAVVSLLAKPLCAKLKSSSN
jgi:hypothetical protein